jgi:hypothetical protein
MNEFDVALDSSDRWFGGVPSMTAMIKVSSELASRSSLKASTSQCCLEGCSFWLLLSVPGKEPVGVISPNKTFTSEFRAVSVKSYVHYMIESVQKRVCSFHCVQNFSEVFFHHTTEWEQGTG